MKRIVFSAGSPEEELARDAAMLDRSEADGGEELLRLWEPRTPFVVTGIGGRIAEEVNLEACRVRGIPVLRRCSGGGTVLQGPGCLNYALVLRIHPRDQWNVQATNRLVLERHRAVAASLSGQPVEIEGLSDLTIGHRKFSGNAQRRRATSVLIHGTFLLRADFDLMEAVLPVPRRQPDYRGGRRHADFLSCLPVDIDRLEMALQNCWRATA